MPNFFKLVSIAVILILSIFGATVGYNYNRHNTELYTMSIANSLAYQGPMPHSPMITNEVGLKRTKRSHGLVHGSLLGPKMEKHVIKHYSDKIYPQIHATEIQDLFNEAVLALRAATKALRPWDTMRDATRIIKRLDISLSHKKKSENKLRKFEHGKIEEVKEIKHDNIENSDNEERPEESIEVSKRYSENSFNRAETKEIKKFSIFVTRKKIGLQDVLKVIEERKRIESETNNEGRYNSRFKRSLSLPITDEIGFSTLFSAYDEFPEYVLDSTENLIELNNIVKDTSEDGINSDIKESFLDNLKILTHFIEANEKLIQKIGRILGLLKNSSTEEIS